MSNVDTFIVDYPCPKGKLNNHVFDLENPRKIRKSCENSQLFFFRMNPSLMLSAKLRLMFILALLIIISCTGMCIRLAREVSSTQHPQRYSKGRRIKMRRKIKRKLCYYARVKSS